MEEERGTEIQRVIHIFSIWCLLTLLNSSQLIELRFLLPYSLYELLAKTLLLKYIYIYIYICMYIYTPSFCISS